MAPGQKLHQRDNASRTGTRDFLVKWPRIKDPQSRGHRFTRLQVHRLQVVTLVNNRLQFDDEATLVRSKTSHYEFIQVIVPWQNGLTHFNKLSTGPICKHLYASEKKNRMIIYENVTKNTNQIENLIFMEPVKTTKLLNDFDKCARFLWLANL